MVRETRLAEVVDHRRLVLPQLSAPGVAAHEVKEACGFRAVFGPVRAADLPAFLAAGMKADAQMRAVTFDARERAVLTPAELQVAWDRRMVLAYAGILAVSAVGRDGVSPRRAARRGGPIIAAAWLALLAGGAATPLALPWLPGRAFSAKGAVAGGIAGGGSRGGVPPPALTGRQARPACGRPCRLLLCRHELHRLLADHLALRRRARDAPCTALAGRGIGRCGRRLACQPSWEGECDAEAALHRPGCHVGARHRALQRLRSVPGRLSARGSLPSSTAAPRWPTEAPAWSAAPAPLTACRVPSASIPAWAVPRRSFTAG